MTRTRAGLAFAGVLAPVMLAWASPLTLVSQARRAFSVRELTIRAGDVVRFSNVDEFLHHIYVRSATFSFNSGEQEPGRNVDVTFPVKGVFEVRCEVHPKMLLTVTVQ